MEARPEILWFAGVMERELKRNDHKPGWGQDSNEALLVRLYEEVEELRAEIDSPPVSATDEAFRQWEGSVLKEAADVANFAMMIADNQRQIAKGLPGGFEDGREGDGS